MTSENGPDSFWADEDDDQLWFDPWEGQIELSSHELSPKKLLLLEQDQIFLDEEEQIFKNFDNNFNASHTLFWNQNDDVSNRFEKVLHLGVNLGSNLSHQKNILRLLLTFSLKLSAKKL